ncbi:unnamed protein product [Bursaphelenchus okinawaensis]|uniref:Uncharacterized protein n=1 Tax=Bursaphelenchus okinawaensis TaxID=465554 RepID=A0A811LTY5_9BILA|nr:unnamed protein product [Bursaphelenchus okinawaensis]CAG9127787.1 unnamed protein product [Bursaphelenchus okinawaensis]
MSFGYVELLNGIAMEMFSSARYLIYNLRSNIEALHFGKGSLLIDMDISLLMEIKKFNETRDFLPFHDVVKSATAITATQVMFYGNKKQVYMLERFLDLIIPCYTEFPWNQVFRMGKINLTLMAAVAKQVVDHLSYGEHKHFPSNYVLQQKERILSEYHAWIQLVDPDGLGQPAFEAFNDLFSNIEFHEKRIGTFTQFYMLPNELKYIIIKKAAETSPTAVDSTGRTFNVMYGNVIEDDVDYNYNLLLTRAPCKKSKIDRLEDNRPRVELDNALDYY